MVRPTTSEGELPFPEPYRVKVVEPIPRPTRAEREEALRRAEWNLFRLPASKVVVDLLTDSGVCAMSSAQWSALFQAEEAYAGSASYARFEEAVREVTGFPEVLPTHQGRGAEKVLFELLAGPGRVVPGNTHFDTTRAHIEHAGARAVDLPAPENADPSSPFPFKGNVDLPALERGIEKWGAERVPLVLVTITNNAAGGHPVSLENLRGVRAVCDRWGIPLFLDAARFAENAFLARERDPSLRQRTVAEVARAYFDLADGCTCSAKKDALVHKGGFLAMRDPALAARARNLLVLHEGFPTYGGLAARDLDAIALGLHEGLDERHLAHRIGQVRFLGEALEREGVPCLRPFGGHAVFVDAGAFLPRIPRTQFPGQALACALYLEAGIRAVEIGSLLFGSRGKNGSSPPFEILRLALPRRVYMQGHLEYVAAAFARLAAGRASIRGLRLLEEAPFLRHFTARLEPLEAPPGAPRTWIGWEAAPPLPSLGRTATTP
ncbi:MAG TPA: tryptophanase [Planctomycetota bacterium]|jgi:tryptophanase|nr:tryptophanase [Planctomycetota bacterium]